MDAALARRRRLELGLSRRAVARDVGVSEGAVARLEGRDGAEDWSLRQLRSFADALALEVTDLIREEAPASETVRHDVETIGALLSRFSRLVPTRTLAHATGWELARVNQAVRALDVAVRPTGQRVQRLRGGVALRPTRSVPDDEELERLLRREMTRTKLNRSQLDMLAAVVDGTFDQLHSEADRLTFASLLNAGLICESTAGPVLGEAARMALGRGGHATT